MNIAGRLLLVLTAALACSNASSMASGPTPLPAASVRVNACDGPAMSLPDSLVRLLRPHGFALVPDDEWARLAATVPGGFAGTYYDKSHRPVIVLARPEEAAAAKVALAAKLPFPMDVAVIERGRWDFAQLSNWFDYLLPRLTAIANGGDKDEAANRIRFFAPTAERRDSLVRTLERMDLPCDLILVDVMSFALTSGN
jgi:hypothetical protein